MASSQRTEGLAEGTFVALASFPSKPSGEEVRMEIVYFIGAFILLAALIYGTLNYRYRDKFKSKVADQIVRDRYQHDRT